MVKAKLISIAQIPAKPIKKLYDWTIGWAKTKKAPYALFFIAFMESSFFPIPPDVLLIPMVIAERKKWFRNALICTAGSVLGAVLGFLIGKFLFEIVGNPIINFYSLADKVEIVKLRYQENAALAILISAFTPIPYKVFTIAAGLFSVAFTTLVTYSIIGRAGRFFLVAFLLGKFGKKISDWIEKYFDLFSLLFAALLIGGFILVKYLI